MPVNAREPILDGYLSVETGVDGGFPPALIPKTSVHWAVNTTFRDGWPEARPGWINREMDFGEDEDLRSGLEDGYFQGAGTYQSDDGRALIAVSVSGRIFTIDITSNYLVEEITISGDTNQVNERYAWFCQAENHLVCQNNLNPAFLYNGATSRRAGDKEVPIGGPMAYGRGRLWVARGSQYFGGDIVYGDPTYGRANVIRFTENEFLNEGGAFAVPQGPVTGMAFAANLDDSLGEGEMIVGTLGDVHSFEAPLDREVWKSLEQPLQRYAARSFGCVGHDSICIVNGDVIYRSPDGIRSLQYSRRDFGSWGQTPISRQVERALRHDTEQYLYASSAVNFDNRLLMTIQPQMDNEHGVWHRGLAVLDYHLVSGMGTKIPPSWEGVWTGLRIFRILTLKVENVIRCFILALNDTGKLQLWEVTKNALFDRDDEDNIPIQWIVETRGMTADTPTRWKRLMGAIQWLDEIKGEVAVQAYYRADESACWHNWDRWSACVEYRNCSTNAICPTYPYAASQEIQPLQAQYRPFIGLTQPPDVPESQHGGLTRDGFEFQLRLECSGRFRLKRLQMMFDLIAQPLWGDARATECAEPEDGSCNEDACASLLCCARDDYGYHIDSDDDEFPTDPSYPTYPDAYPAGTYPDGTYPGGGGGGGGGGGDGGGGDGGGGGGGGGTDPVFDPLGPSDYPTLTDACDDGTIIWVESNYVWSFGPTENPNDLLTPDQVACHVALHGIEVADAISFYEGLGYVVTEASGAKWYYSGYVGVLLAMFLKSTCDPNDGIDDHYVSFSGYTTLIKGICVRSP